MAAAGSTADDIPVNAANRYAGEFSAVVEGSVPTAGNGISSMIGGKTMLNIAGEILLKAKEVIARGTCAAYGGLAAASPTPQVPWE